MATDQEKENQRIAITYILAMYAGDEQQMKSIQSVIPLEDLINEITKLTLTVVVSSSLFINPTDPPDIEYILGKLRTITYE